VKRLLLLFAALGAAMAILGLVLPGNELLTIVQHKGGGR
jgi:hypothetical protein